MARSDKLTLVTNYGVFEGTVLFVQSGRKKEEVLVVSTSGKKIPNWDPTFFPELYAAAEAGNASLGQAPRNGIKRMRWENGPDFRLKDGHWIKEAVDRAPALVEV